MEIYSRLNLILSQFYIKRKNKRWRHFQVSKCLQKLKLKIEGKKNEKKRFAWF